MTERGDPATGGSSGPASAAEVEAVEDELLGRIVDAPEVGGLNPHAARPDVRVDAGETLPDAPGIVQDIVEMGIDPDPIGWASAESAAGPGDAAPRPASGPAEPPTPTPAAPVVTDGAAHVEDLLTGVMTAPPPRDRTPRTYTQPRILAFATILLMAAVVLAVVGGMLVLDQGRGPLAADAPVGAPGPAGSGAGAAGQPDSAPPGGGQPAAGAAVLPTTCFVPLGGALDLELTDVEWREDDGQYGGWTVIVHNRDTETFALFPHVIDEANEATRANRWEGGPTDWRTDGFWMVDPDATDDTPTTFRGRLSTSVEEGLPTLCQWTYTDRVVAVWYRPGCSGALWDQVKAAPDVAAREALLGPFAIEVPVPDRVVGWSCPD